MFQKCPKCNGEGTLTRSIFTGVDPPVVETYRDQCPLCLGEFVIHEEQGVPPSVVNKAPVGTVHTDDKGNVFFNNRYTVNADEFKKLFDFSTDKDEKEKACRDAFGKMKGGGNYHEFKEGFEAGYQYNISTWRKLRF